MARKRIYVTGFGIVSALGVGADAHLSALHSHKSGIGEMKYLQSVHNDLPVGEVKMTNEQICEAIGIKRDSRFTRTSLLGTLALKEALESAGIDNEADGHISLISGTTVGGMDKSEEFFAQCMLDGADVDFIKTHDCGITTEFALDFFPCFDQTTTVSTACSSAANAIIFGANLIRTGRYEIAVVGGSECISKFHLNGFNSLMILDKEPCRPFDASRAGLNLGEGAAYLVLESEDSVRSRGVKPLCELKGYGNACDAYHQTASSPDGAGAWMAMNKALKDSGLDASEIDYVNAHGTGTPNNDLSEGIALERVFGKGNVPPVSSTKAYTGHTTSASGAIEAVISILALRNGFYPVNLNFNTRIDGLSFDPVTCETPVREIKNVLSNSFGFGGNDSSVIFSKVGEEM